MSHVVDPKVERLTLPDGAFVDVKKELNAGEYVDLLTDQGKGVSFAKILHYVVGWSLVGLDDKPLPYSIDVPAATRLDTLRALTVPVMIGLVKAVEAHEEAQEKARTKKKKSLDALSVSSPTSISAVQ